MQDVHSLVTAFLICKYNNDNNPFDDIKWKHMSHKVPDNLTEKIFI